MIASDISSGLSCNFGSPRSLYWVWTIGRQLSVILPILKDNDFFDFRLPFPIRQFADAVVEKEAFERVVCDSLSGGRELRAYVCSMLV